MPYRIDPDAVAKYRILAGLTQRELAEKCEVSEGHIQGVEAGRSGASPRLLVRMETAMEIPAEYLLTEVEDKASA